VFLLLCARHSCKGNKARGKEALFLTMTFQRLGNGRITLDIGSAGGEYFFDVVNILSDFDLSEDF